METWLKHEDHGHMKAYDSSTLKECKRNGWEVMTKAEVKAYLNPPAAKAKPKPKEDPPPPAPEGDEPPAGTVNHRGTELAALSIPDILEQFEDLTNDDLVSLKEHELANDNRVTLIREIDEELENRGHSE